MLDMPNNVDIVVEIDAFAIGSNGTALTVRVAAAAAAAAYRTNFRPF